MWLLGHLGLGYIFGYAVEKLSGEKFNIPLVLFCSLLPDLDFFFQAFIFHRGPTHSIVVYSAVFLLIYLVSHRGLPYFASIASHLLIGDFFHYSTLQLLWPISEAWINAPSSLRFFGNNDFLVEVSLFSVMLLLIVARYWGKPKEFFERMFSL
jgi:membrane-bound metal-dependent hydrolase YbcI (DUF457 family)